MRKDYYVHGSTVRKVEPNIQPNRRSWEEERRKKARRNAVRRNREKAFVMSRAYVLFLGVCVGISAFATFKYIQLQSKVANTTKNISVVESQITDLKADNDAREKNLNVSVDLNYVKDVAMNELGMSYATEEQVVYYSIDKSNYIEQYSDIPE